MLTTAQPILESVFVTLNRYHFRDSMSYKQRGMRDGREQSDVLRFPKNAHARLMDANLAQYLRAMQQNPQMHVSLNAPSARSPYGLEISLYLADNLEMFKGSISCGDANREARVATTTNQYYSLENANRVTVSSANALINAATSIGKLFRHPDYFIKSMHVLPHPVFAGEYLCLHDGATRKV